MVNPFSWTVLRLKPSAQREQHSHVQLSHYSCIFRMTSLVASELSGDLNRGGSAHECVIRSLSPYRNDKKTFKPKFSKRISATSESDVIQSLQIKYSSALAVSNFSENNGTAPQNYKTSQKALTFITRSIDTGGLLLNMPSGFTRVFHILTKRLRKCKDWRLTETYITILETKRMYKRNA